jgi:DNA-binding CsgD family transcriptional regulator
MRRDPLRGCPLRGSTRYRGASGITAQRPRAELRKTQQANAVILEPKQEKAVEYMLAGASDSEIAKKLKVTRQTVNYWRNQDFDFIYELQMRRNQLWEGYRDKLSDLYKMAVEEVKKSFKSKDPKTRLQVAMQILRLPALQENLKSKAPTDRKTIEKERFDSALHIALSEVTEEMGY